MTASFHELIHVDIPLALVELHYQEEALANIPWSDEPFPFSPYIVYERRDGVVYMFYDDAGIEWQKRQAGKYVDEEGAISRIRSGYDAFKDVIEGERALDRDAFLSFIEGLRTLYPWLNYMWWAIEYRDEHDLPMDDLLATRKYTENFSPGLFAVFRNSLRGMYPELGNRVDALLLSEVLEDEVPAVEELDRRLDAFWYTDGRLFDSQREIEATYDLRIEHESVEELRGRPAHPGKVEGEVRIVRRRADIQDFPEGAVLVASTTTPDYLPAMKCASAIVSEHGGAICHAAITSRELKIPCVVGVKGATKLLEDGMRVEVDATKGIIHRLSDDAPQ